MLSTIDKKGLLFKRSLIAVVTIFSFILVSFGITGWGNAQRWGQDGKNYSEFQGETASYYVKADDQPTIQESNLGQDKTAPLCPGPSMLSGTENLLNTTYKDKAPPLRGWLQGMFWGTNQISAKNDYYTTFRGSVQATQLAQQAAYPHPFGFYYSYPPMIWGYDYKVFDTQGWAGSASSDAYPPFKQWGALIARGVNLFAQCPFFYPGQFKTTLENTYKLPAPWNNAPLIMRAEPSMNLVVVPSNGLVSEMPEFTPSSSPTSMDSDGNQPPAAYPYIFPMWDREGITGQPVDTDVSVHMRPQTAQNLLVDKIGDFHAELYLQNPQHPTTEYLKMTAMQGSPLMWFEQRGAKYALLYNALCSYPNIKKDGAALGPFRNTQTNHLRVDGPYSLSGSNVRYAIISGNNTDPNQGYTDSGPTAPEPGQNLTPVPLVSYDSAKKEYTFTISQDNFVSWAVYWIDGKAEFTGDTLKGQDNYLTFTGPNDANYFVIASLPTQRSYTGDRISFDLESAKSYADLYAKYTFNYATESKITYSVKDKSIVTTTFEPTLTTMGDVTGQEYGETVFGLMPHHYQKLTIASGVKWDPLTQNTSSSRPEADQNSKFHYWTTMGTILPYIGSSFTTRYLFSNFVPEMPPPPEATWKGQINSSTAISLGQYVLNSLTKEYSVDVGKEVQPFGMAYLQGKNDWYALASYAAKLGWQAGVLRQFLNVYGDKPGSLRVSGAASFPLTDDALNAQKVVGMSTGTDSVVKINITNKGSGYKQPKVTITPPPAGGIQAVAADYTHIGMDQSGGVVNIPILTPGSGYTSAPQITITDNLGSGTGATATAEMGTPLYVIYPDVPQWSLACAQATSVKKTLELWVKSLQNGLSIFFNETPETFTTPQGDDLHMMVVHDSDAHRVICYPTGTTPVTANATKTHDTGMSVYDGFAEATQFQDMHYQYGYFLVAAGLAGIYDTTWDDTYSGSTWASKTGHGPAIDQMILTLGYDPDNAKMVNENTGYWKYGSIDISKSYPKFSFFDQYCGHGWATGLQPSLILGNTMSNENSCYEGIQAWAGIILWGAATQRPDMVDLGIYLYATNAHVADIYYLDKNQNYKNGQQIEVGGGGGTITTWMPQATATETVTLFEGNEYKPQDGTVDYYSVQKGLRGSCTQYPNAISPMSMYSSNPCASLNIIAFPNVPWLTSQGRSTDYMKNVWTNAFTTTEWSTLATTMKGIPEQFNGNFAPYAMGLDMLNSIVGQTSSSLDPGKTPLQAWIDTMGTGETNDFNLTPLKGYGWPGGIVHTMKSASEYGIPDFSVYGNAGDDIVFSAVFVKDGEQNFMAFNPHHSNTVTVKFYQVATGNVDPDGPRQGLQVPPKSWAIYQMPYHR
ncbi:MAG: glycosyl hydrolase [Pseudomonadota bacterium]